MGEDQDRGQRLSTAEMAKFVSRGFLVFESVVPDDINAAALDLFAETGVDDHRRAKPDSGTPLGELYPEPSPIGAMLRLPRVHGIVTSLVGADAVFDHDWVHVRESGDVVDQHLHQDAIVDPSVAFDIQLFWFPHDVGPGEGGTGLVPGSHLRIVNEADIARYQNVLGQRDLAVPAGSIAVFHQGLWHRGRSNAGPRRRFMYKIRLNPTRPQVKQWNLDDFEAVHGVGSDHIFATMSSGSTAAASFRRTERWHEVATGRLETVQRARLWRYLTGDDSFDTDWYLTRAERRRALTDSVVL